MDGLAFLLNAIAYNHSQYLIVEENYASIKKIKPVEIVDSRKAFCLYVLWLSLLAFLQCGNRSRFVQSDVTFLVILGCLIIAMLYF